MTSLETMFLDVIDLQILNLLKENSRAKLTKLATDVNLTPAAIKRRIERLVECGIIDRFTISINYRKVGFDILAYLVINAASKEKISSITISLKKFPEIAKITVLMGDPDFIAEIHVNDLNTLINLVKKISQIEEIQNFKTWFIMDIINS
ncbi:MAG TPA: AsnC family transcriptional regulator [Candidatus Deferrimicrobium sp.]|nr:AsnC family transcriptional regulator [Candidatus Deferrimicrobium sp.]